VISTPCPYCDGPLLLLQTVRTCCAHYGCPKCRAVFVFEGKKAIMCTMPHKHVSKWDRSGSLPDVTIPEVVPVSGGMDLL